MKKGVRNETVKTSEATKQFRVRIVSNATMQVQMMVATDKKTLVASRIELLKEKEKAPSVAVAVALAARCHFNLSSPPHLHSKMEVSLQLKQDGS